MSFFVYILRCADGSYYVGHTDQLEARIAAHERGEIAGYTRKRRPVRLVFAEEIWDTAGDAGARDADEGLVSREEGSADETQLEALGVAVPQSWFGKLTMTYQPHGPSTSSGRTESSRFPKSLLSLNRDA